MANPQAALDIKFNPKVMERRPPDPGRVEADDFYINDVALRIPPKDIHIQKESFNHEWNTLRTESSRKAKSGYGIARVTISTIFRISNFTDSDNLSRVVAGLRATPFCVIHNRYLDQMLGRPDDETPVASGKRTDSSRSFQPIMLAMASMSFSTMGHAKSPDCIQATFDFLWFNYLPFTSFVAFKSGSNLDRPGHAWESPLWEAFYKPFYNSQPVPTFPHAEEDVAGGRTTEFMWREFLLVPKGNPVGLEASIELANALKNKPKELMSILAGIVSKGTVGSEAERADLKNPDSITSGILDTLYRKAIKKGIINPSDAVRKQLATMKKGSITLASGGLLAPIIRQMYGKDSISTRTQNSVDVAAALLAERLKKLRDIAKRYSSKENVPESWPFKPILEANANYGGKDAKSSAGGFKLFGRKQRLQIVHKSGIGDFAPGAIIQQIVVTFRNTLATIPMLAYRYPTIQHIGSINAEVTFVINAQNSAAEDIRTMYDKVETTALRFRTVPSGFTNLNIHNDFLGLFGLEEFLTTRLEISPIEGMPGRSNINLTVENAGLTSKTKDPEQLQQEFISGDFSMFKEIYKVLKKNMEDVGGLSGANGVGASGFFSSIPGFIGVGRKDINKPTDAAYYRKKIWGAKLGTNDAAYTSSVRASLFAYNEYIKEIHQQVFGQNTIEGSSNYAAIMSLEEDNAFFGYIPGIDQIKRSLIARNTAYRNASENNKVRSAKYQSAKKLQKQAKANRMAANLTGNAVSAQKTGSVFDTSLANKVTNAATVQRNAAAMRMRKIFNMGTNRYLTKMRTIFAKVLSQQITLKQFKHLEKRRDELGLDKGIMAYPDFRNQLSSVAALVEGAQKKQDSILMKYEPDCYFYYPLYNGATSSPLLSVIDPYYLTVAKTHSTNVVQEAQTRMDTFFQGIYHERLNNPTSQGPYLSLTKDFGGTQLAPRLYKDNNILNSTQIDTIKKSVVCDPQSKVPTNWYPHKFPIIKSSNLTEHTTDMNQLWDGVGSSTGGAGSTVPSAPQSTRKGSGNSKKILKESPYLSKKNTWKKLTELRVEAQPVFEAVLDDMVSQGYDPVISGAYRTPTSQREKVIKGWAQHSATRLVKKAKSEGLLPANMSLKDGRRHLIDNGQIIVKVGRHNWGLALDIKPRGWGWKSITPDVAAFYGALTMTAQKHGLVSGGIWFGKGGTRKKPTQKSFWNKHGLGWDPAHIQMNYYNGNRIPKAWKFDVMKSRAGQQKGAQRYSPPGPVQKRLDQVKSQPIARDVTATISSPLGQAISEFERDLYNGQAQSMMRAYPAFKLYFVEDDKNEKRLSFDDFFSYHAVQSIRVIRSRKIAADLCEIYVTNISGVLSNRKFRNSRKKSSPHTAQGKPTTEAQSSMKAGTKHENPIASLLLQEGMHIHLRLGYTSDPDRMSTVFNGKITEVQFSESDDLVRIVAQSYAVELAQDLKGIQKPTNKSSWAAFGWDFWGFSGNATTGRILEEMMAEPEVLHFGRWTPTAGGSNPAREMLTQRWTFQPQPQDDNIFAPSSQEDLGKLADGLFFKNLKYIIYRTTIWDIFQEMTLRHPNFVALPVPYQSTQGQRMTMFFGLPNQLYFSRDPKANEQDKDMKLKQLQRDAETKILAAAGLQVAKKKAIGANISSMSKVGAIVNVLGKGKVRETLRAIQPIPDATKIVKNAVGNFYREQRLREAKKAGYISSFRTYHLITSSQHLIVNNIRANARDVANTIVIKYGRDVEIKDGASGEKLNGIAIKGDEEQFTLKLDNALPTEEIRTQMGQFINVTNPDLAKRYALGLLCRNMREIYKGEIVMVGNPKIKPHDVCLDGDTLISTSKKLVPIKDIKIGDIVYTHSGNQHKVTQLFKTEPKEDFYDIKCKTDPDSIKITGNHPIFSIKRDEVYNDSKPWIGRKLSDYVPKFRRADSLSKNDYIAIPRLYNDQKLPKALARLLGYYLAEGSIVWECRKTSNIGTSLNRKQLDSLIPNTKVPVAIQWSFDSVKESFVLKEINSLLLDLGYNKKARGYKDSRSNGWSIVFYDRKLTTQVVELAGFNTKDNNEGKWIRQFYNIETTKNILGAYFNGDGSSSTTIRKGSLCSGGTSLMLGRNLRQMIINCGIPVCSSISKNKSEWAKKDGVVYSNNISTFYSNKIVEYTWYDRCPNIQKKTNCSALVDSSYVYLPISIINKIDKPSYVYNIGVENKHTYIANNKAVHNCYLFDEYTDMVGAFEVEEVQHIFDQQHGFRTEIKPDMLVQASELSLLGSAEALGIVMEGALRKMGIHNKSLLNFMSPNAYMMGHGVSMFGGFMAQKIVNFTQLAQPIIMSPLLHHGRMFTGGVPTRKIPTSGWSTAFGNWDPMVDTGYSDWMEDKKDEMLGWIGNKLGGFSTGNFFNNGGDSPE